MSDRVCDDHNAEALLDETPLAYKPLEAVTEDSKDLVESVTVLKAFINYLAGAKGTTGSTSLIFELRLRLAA